MEIITTAVYILIASVLTAIAWVFYHRGWATVPTLLGLVSSVGLMTPALLI